MLVSKMLVSRELSPVTTTRHNDGARLALPVLEGMHRQMAPSNSSLAGTSEGLSPSSSTSTVDENDDEFPMPSTSCSRMIGNELFAMDDFEVLEMLGEGFFSKVSRVRHRETGAEMVLKVMKPSRGTRRAAHLETAREAAMMRRLSHENVLALRGLCIECSAGGWDMHLLVDFCDGGSLSRLILDRQRHFPWAQRVHYAVDIARSMAYMHQQRIIHRDLTSMNVLLKDTRSTAWGRAVVADFGLSCEFPKEGDPRLPQVGTTYFMSPEILKEQEYDEKTDVFSFGIILCQLIARIEADPDSGLHRTSNFGLDYTLFTPNCPCDTPIELLKVAFQCCLMNPSDRPAFPTVATLLKSFRVSQYSPLSERNNKGLMRSRSDASLKRPTLLKSRKLSNQVFAPLVEGVVDDSEVSLRAMQQLARDVAKDEQEPLADHVNPFLEHERFRKERKIVPNHGTRRRSETTKSPSVTRRERSVSFAQLRRWYSLPYELDDPFEDDDSVDAVDAVANHSGICMEYRNIDKMFLNRTAPRASGRRRHTIMHELKPSLTIDVLDCRSLFETDRSNTPKLSRSEVDVSDMMEVAQVVEPQLISLQHGPPPLCSKASTVVISQQPSASCLPRRSQKHSCVLL